MDARVPSNLIGITQLEKLALVASEQRWVEKNRSKAKTLAGVH
jgi:hypothetical protein